MKKIATAAIAAAALGAALAPSSASAAHCVSPAGDSPGFSYFGTVHVKGTAHDEGHGVHAGTSGASNCRETSGNPAERAPGQS